LVLPGAILVGCDTTQESIKPTTQAAAKPITQEATKPTMPEAAKPTTREAAKPTPSPGVVTGTVTYLQRIALPPQVSVLVKLEDVSLQDAPAKLISAQRIELGGKQVPIPFELRYDPAKIDPKHTYNVSARIVLGDQLLFASDTAHRVITDNNPSSVEIIVRSVPTTTPKSP
jgi:uncharacterized lipoprotein YbaY